MVKSAAIVFGTLDASLASKQTLALQERLAELAPRMHFETIIREMPPVIDDDEPNEPFLACRRTDMAALAEMISRGECRCVVVQAYDLPVPLPEGTEILCVPSRSTPFDALLHQKGLIMDELDPGSRIGVLCLRAKSQLQCHWPDFKFQILAGGVDGAMEIHRRSQEIDGLILPAAVTEYLGIQGIVSEIFSPDFILPAPGQGTLAVLGAAGDTELAKLLAPLHSDPSAREMSAEMAFRSHMITDVDLPIGALARIQGSSLSITGATGCGTDRVSVHGGVDDVEAVGAGLAQQLLSRPESFVDLLEADFPQGLPPDDEADPDDALDEDPDTTPPADEDAYLEELMRNEGRARDPDPGPE